MNPFTLPDSQAHIAFSGGGTSAFMLHQIIEANGGNSVRFAWPGDAQILISHELDIEEAR